MKLYHGTTEAAARAAFEDGLSPRADLGIDSNWEDHPSRDDMIYLTRAYASYFAMCAAGPDEKWGLVEIDTNELYEECLFPDEDFLEQASRRGSSPCPDDLDMGERTAWFREHLLGFQPYWKDSVDGLGNCAYHGYAPPCAISRVVIYEPTSNPVMTGMSVDPSISIMNYQILGGSKYRALTDWFFGYEVTLGDFDPFLTQLGEVPEGMRDMLRKRSESLTQAISNREGIEVLS